MPHCTGLRVELMLSQFLLNESTVGKAEPEASFPCVTCTVAQAPLLEGSSSLGLMIYCHCLEIFTNVRTRDPICSFCTGHCKLCNPDLAELLSQHSGHLFSQRGETYRLGKRWMACAQARCCQLLFRDNAQALILSTVRAVPAKSGGTPQSKP